MFQSFVNFASAEWILKSRPNGGTAVFLRSLMVTVEIYIIAIGLKSYTTKGAVLEFDATQLRVAMEGTVPWIGAIFAATYAALYSRYAAQWSYLSNLYNQVMAFSASIFPKYWHENEAAVYWCAGFVEDAYDLHLDRKPMFAAMIRSLIREKVVRDSFVQSCHDGTKKLAEIDRRLEKIFGQPLVVRSLPIKSASTGEGSTKESASEVSTSHWGTIVSVVGGRLISRRIRLGTDRLRP